MTDLEEKIRAALHDSQWDLATWPDPMPRVRRAAARQRARLAATTLVLAAAIVTPIALLSSTTGTRPTPKPPGGNATATSTQFDASRVPSWASHLGGEVAYKCGDSVCLMRPGGTGHRTLGATKTEWDPSWSPDGRRLTFRGYYGQGDGQYDLYVANANGCQVTRLTHNLNGTSSSWSPNGRQIVFSTPQGIYVINFKGTGLRRLVRGEKTSYGVDTPTWSRSNLIAYARYLPARQRTEIYTVKTDGSGVSALTRGRPGFGQPAWSPDGHSIAFVANPDSTSSIEVAAADGTGPHRVSPRGWISYSPTWTPSGQIVFLHQLGTATRTSAYIMNSNGSDLRLLYPNLNATQIAWGPAHLPRGRC